MKNIVTPAVTSMSPRKFVTGTTPVLTALSASPVFGANERINVGLIGFDLIGRFHVAALNAQPDVPVKAVSDAHQGHL